jgi:hypothetical protein
MALLRIALESNPSAAKLVLEKINQNDLKIADNLRRLASEHQWP